MMHSYATWRCQQRLCNFSLENPTPQYALIALYKKYVHGATFARIVNLKGSDRHSSIKTTSIIRGELGTLACRSGVCKIGGEAADQFIAM